MPASAAAGSASGSSTSASGLPSGEGDEAGAHLGRHRRARACGEQLGRGRRVEARRATSSGRSASNRRTSPSRAANSSAIRSSTTRRATNSSAAAEASSSHCASSTTASTGAVLGGFGEQAQRGQEDAEAVGVGVHVRRAEGGQQGAGLRGGQATEVVQHGAQQPLQRSEGQRRLGLDAPDAEHLHVVPGRALPTAWASSADFPTPGRPRTTRAPPRPARASATTDASAGSLRVAPVQHRTEPTIRRRIDPTVTWMSSRERRRPVGRITACHDSRVDHGACG